MPDAALEPAILVEGLQKSYGGTRAIDGVSFSVARGEIFALLGPNGAGKTTTLEILEGLRAPDSGTVRVLSLEPRRGGSELRSKIGVMLQEAGLYPAITCREALELFASYYPRPDAPVELLARVGLVDAAGTQYRHLSGGQKQRLALALALVGRPELVFLDEPTAGLDPQARRATWELIAGLGSAGTTVMLTTHYLLEAERLADRVAIMDHGRLVRLGPPSQLIAADTSIVHVRLPSPVNIGVLSALPSAEGVHANGSGEYVINTGDAGSLLVELTACLRDQGVLPTELRIGRGSLEEVFLNLTGPEPDE